MKLLILLATLFSFSQETFANSKYDMKIFAKIPILAGGRIKPLDTFAKVTLLTIYEKSKTKDQKAIEWFAELLFAPDKAYNRKIFRIRNKDVIKAINIKFDKAHLYSFVEIYEVIRNLQKLAGEINAIPPKERSPSQKQIHALFSKVTFYYELSRSLSLLDPQFSIPNQEYADVLKLPYGKKLTFLQVLKRKTLFKNLANDIYSKKKKDKALSGDQSALFDIGRKLEIIEQDSSTSAFRIVPPQFEKSLDKAWNSPWQTIQKGEGNPLTVGYFKIWTNLHTAYRSNDLDYWNEVSLEAYYKSVQLSSGLVSAKKLKWEERYNSWDLFTKSVAFYIFAFLVLAVSWLVKKKTLEDISLYSVIIGGVMHTFNLGLRCYIMSRPPVSTLYESIIFVSVIAVIGAILLEIRQRNTNGTLIGTALGTILLFISFSYEKDGDSMGMLAAVLDTNFWLATHVVTITIGYGCCFVSSLLGHIYLIKKFFPKKFSDAELKETFKSIWGTTLFALFFTVLGTILGGIWADQSWGRFWGWDPKENGAMLICMWVLWVIHGKIARYFSEGTFAIATAYTSVTVVLAWFGVNLLNVGLHSYGFTDSIANNIMYFTIAETVFCVVAWFILKSQSKKSIKI